MSSKNVKKSKWAFVLYPESAPSNWRDLLQETGLQIAISPLHDKDVNPDNTLKKPHYHIILVYEGPTTFNNVNYLTSSLNQPIPQPLDSIRGYYRYFTHEDNPEKFHYNFNDITTINGFDVKDYLELTANQVIACLTELTTIIKDNNITEYSSLIDLLIENDYNELLDVAMNKTIYLNTYITSRRHSQKN